MGFANAVAADKELDSSEVEKEVRFKLREILEKRYQVNLEKNLEELLTLEGGFVERFQFFAPLIPSPGKERMLISGCAVGSELVVAERYGFKEIHGTEVVPDYVNLANRRLAARSNMEVVFYEGRYLPYPSDYFTTIYSGHIIEHTGSPRFYFAEHMRVLRSGGFFFLEFPERYHPIELHTGMPSKEWLPLPLRYLAIKALCSKFSSLTPEHKNYIASF